MEKKKRLANFLKIKNLSMALVKYAKLAKEKDTIKHKRKKGKGIQLAINVSHGLKVKVIFVAKNVKKKIKRKKDIHIANIVKLGLKEKAMCAVMNVPNTKKK